MQIYFDSQNPLDSCRALLRGAGGQQGARVSAASSFLEGGKLGYRFYGEGFGLLAMEGQCKEALAISFSQVARPRFFPMYAVHTDDSQAAAPFSSGMAVFHPAIEAGFLLAKGARFRLAVVFCSEEWLKGHLDGQQDADLRYRLFLREPFYFFERSEQDLPLPLAIERLFVPFVPEQSFLQGMTTTYQLVAAFFRLLSLRDRSYSHYSLEKEDLGLMFRVNAWIEEALPGFPSLETLCQKSGLSDSALQHKFRHLFGRTLYGQHLYLKMQRAHELVVADRQSIKEIGQALGYSNMSRFTDAFKAQFGQRPKEVQLRHRKGGSPKEEK